MVALFIDFLNRVPLAVLFAVIAGSLFVLAKGADILVEEAVTLSLKWGVPKMIIGATIVSLGTTLPEASVSVFATMTGQPGLALGNAAGSIICDTGLILGIAALIAPLKLEKPMVVRQGWLKIAAGLLLVALSLPFSSLSTVFSEGGHLPRWAGFLFLGLLVLYIWFSIRQSRGASTAGTERDLGIEPDPRSTAVVLLKLILGIALVVVSSRILIPAVQETAYRLRVPDSIIAATLVAFGTSLPELVTAITAARKGHGELAIGNVIGADILNVLFVSGAAAAVTRNGLFAPPQFFTIIFPSMLVILAVFSIGINVSKRYLGRTMGSILLVLYIGYTALSYAGG